MNEETYDTVWDSTNDYSYDDLVSFEDDNNAAAITEKITLYADDKLVWGVEPDGTKPEDVVNEPTDEVLYGDANCDGKVTLSDAILIMQSIGNPDSYNVGGDDKSAITKQGAINGDCSNPGSGLTNLDSLAIQKYLLKLLDKLPE